MKTKGLSWPVMWLIIVVLLVVGYGVGQALHLDHHTTSSAPAAVSTVATVAGQHR